MAYDERTAGRVRKLLSGQRGVVEKKLMGGLCFMVKGGMCCSVSGRGGLLVRVGVDMHERMLAEPHATAMEMGGRIMKRFVRVAPEGYRTEAALKEWLERGLAAVAERTAKGGRKKPKQAPKRRKN